MLARKVSPMHFPFPTDFNQKFQKEKREREGEIKDHQVLHLTFSMLLWLKLIKYMSYDILRLEKLCVLQMQVLFHIFLT